jgi:hypothetical protein
MYGLSSALLLAQPTQAGFPNFLFQRWSFVFFFLFFFLYLLLVKGHRRVGENWRTRGAVWGGAITRRVKVYSGADSECPLVGLEL